MSKNITNKMQTYSVEEFEKHFSDLTSQVCDKIEPLFDKATYPNLRMIVCKMKVKGGKRIIVEYLTQKSKIAHPNVSNMFVTAWNRKADKSQRDELTAYNIQVHIPSTKKNVGKIINDIQKINGYKHIHLDELDFGSGDTSLLSQVFAKFKEDSKSLWILYSATPEELTCCQKWLDLENSGEGIFVEIDPAATYIGIKDYIEKGLMVKSESMFNFEKVELTNQGKDVLETAALKYLQDLRNCKEHVRNVAVLRVNGKHKNKSRFNWVIENNTILQQHLDNIFGVNKIPLYIVDVGSKSDNDVKWDNYKFWESKADKFFYIFLVEQSACRATEFRCHHKLSFYHSHRYTDEPSINTIIQDQERCVFYKLHQNHDHSKKYPGYINLEPSCVIYGDVDVAFYSAGYTELDYLLNKRKDLCPSSRTQVLRFLTKNKIHVFEAKTEHELNSILIKKFGDLKGITSTFPDHKTNDKGFKMCTVRGCEVFTKEFIITTNYGVYKNDKVNGRKFVCYTNIDDITTEVYVALVNDGTKYNGEIKTDSSNSMYSK
jgi:hypothetical protein